MLGLLMKNDIYSLAKKTILDILFARGEIMPETISLDSKISDDVGLTSLEFAELISVLETHLDCDPFTEEYSVTDVVTLDDLCKAYAKSLSRSAVASVN